MDPCPPRRRGRGRSPLPGLVVAVASVLLVPACGWLSDATPPRVALVRPVSGVTVDQPRIDVVVQVMDDGAVAHVEVLAPGVASTACAATGQGRYACSGVPLLLGDNVLTARARDAAGNVGTLNFLVRRVSPPDVVAPSVALLDVADGDTVTTSAITLRAMVVDAGAVASVRFGTDRGAAGACAPVGSEVWACGPVQLPVGDTTITVTAEDAAGNVASASVTLTREEVAPPPDVTPPRVAIVQPQDARTVTSGDLSPWITASDDVGVASVRYATEHGAAGACEAALGAGYLCPSVPLPVGSTRITVTALDAAGNGASDAVTVQRVAPPTPSFDIEIVFFDESFTTPQRAAFATAAARWEELVVGDLEDVTVALPASGSCGRGEPAYDGTIDDLVIFATSFTEGVGGLLGSAGPCLYRSSGADAGTHLVGLMRFDTADLANLEAQGALVDVIVHEMGHVLGFGTAWQFPPYADLLDYVPIDAAPSCRTAGGFLRDPSYLGASGVAGWNAQGGDGPVPVEETGGPGTQCGHWDEAVFGNELMTGFLNLGGPNPLSAMTVRSLEDLGLTVDASAADPYVRPSGTALRAPDGLNLMAGEELLLPRGSVDPATGRVEVPARPIRPR